MTPGTGKFFPANNYHMHLFNGSYECMENGNIKEPMADDIVTRLRDSRGMTTCRSSDGFMSIIPDTGLMREAADEIERLRKLAYLLIDELRFDGGYEAYTSKMLFDEFYEQAVRGE